MMRTMMTAGAVLAFAGAALAQQGTVGATANFVDPSGPFDDGPVVYTDTMLSLPAVESIDFVTFELSHSYGSDLHLALQAPTGDIFNLAISQGGASLAPSQYDIFGPFTGGFNGTQLGDGTASLDNLTTYNFAASGDEWLGAGFGNLQPAGTYAAEEFPLGGWDAGDWRVVVLDTFPTIDLGALGSFSITYTIPTPGTAGLLGLAGLVAVRRRR